MLEEILIGLPIVTGCVCLAGGIIGYIALVLKLSDKGYTKTAALLGAIGTFVGVLLLSFMVGMDIKC